MHMMAISDVKLPKWRSATYVVAPDLNRLTDSIKQFGMLSPIVVQRNGTIIDGCYRYEIAKSLKMREVPVNVVDVDDVDALFLHVDLNRYRGIVVAKFLSWLIQRMIVSDKYSRNDIRRKLAMTGDEFELLSDGSLIKMRKIKQHTYSPAWVPIESKTGEDITIERPTGHSEQV